MQEPLPRHKEEKVIRDQNNKKKIKNTEEKSLFPVFSHGFPKIVPNENGFPADKFSENIGDANIDKTKGEEHKSCKEKAYPVSRCECGIFGLYRKKAIQGIRVCIAAVLQKESAYIGKLRCGRRRILKAEYARKSEQSKYKREVSYK